MQEELTFGDKKEIAEIEHEMAEAEQEMAEVKQDENEEANISALSNS